MYIGITKFEDKPNKRWNNGKGYVDNEHFFNAICKYGWDNFQHEIFAKGLDEVAAKATERLLIEYFQTNNPEKGYNKTSGGDGTCDMPEETIQKKVVSYKKFYEEHPEKRKERSEKVKGENNPMYGKSIKDYMTPEAYEQWLYHVQHPSEETREKMRKNHAHISGEAHYNYGKHLSEETKEKIRQTRKERGIGIGENNPNYGSDKQAGHKNGRAKPVYCVELNKIYWGATGAQQEMGIKFRQILACCNHRSTYILYQENPDALYQKRTRLHWLFAEEAIEKGYITNEELEDYLRTLA